MKLTFDIPEGKSGDFSIEKRTTDFLAGRSVPQDTYTCLIVDGIDTVMQDTQHEYAEHQPLWDNATGDVLIGGLGIGFVNQKLMDNPDVTSVTIIEKNQEVIDMVWGHCPKDDTFTLIHADIEIWAPTQNYHVGWFDTWLTSNAMSHREYVKYMTGKYEKSCKWIGFWRQVE